MELLWLVPVLPLLGACVLALAGGLLPKRAAGAVGAGSVAASFAVSLVVLFGYLGTTGEHRVLHQTFGTWFRAGSLHVPFGLYLDELSLVMTCTVTFVSLLIHVYALEFMWEEGAFPRFFCYLNLFVGSMLLLLLADSFVLLYLGWEGVGLCSYLLIGFWYHDPANIRAANKAFIITRVGDAALAIAFFILFAQTGTLDIQTALGRVSTLGPGLLLGTCLLLLGGAAGKSGQLPLHTWLPDAMAGPTPVSALIHAATMVTAGVYLVARTFPLFLHSQAALVAVAGVGAATALVGASSALAQHDIKRMLAYSTSSQVGYMFLALGAGAWSAAIFHFFTHAFFKALLFLTVGIVLRAQGEEHDIRRLGGLWRRLPVAGWGFLAGGASLAALPLVTAGFYSKDAILWSEWASPWGSHLLWGVAVAAAVLTALYVGRTFLLVFLGDPQRPIERSPGLWETLPVAVLAVLSLGAGFLGMPHVLGGFDPFGELLGHLFGERPWLEAAGEGAFLVYGAIASLSGLALAYLIFVREPVWAPRLAGQAGFRALRRFLFLGWGFDWLYARVVVRPYLALSRANRGDAVDLLYRGLALTVGAVGDSLTRVQSGKVRTYAAGLLLGAVLLVALLRPW